MGTTICYGHPVSSGGRSHIQINWLRALAGDDFSEEAKEAAKWFCSCAVHEVFTNRAFFSHGLAGLGMYFYEAVSVNDVSAARGAYYAMLAYRERGLRAALEALKALPEGSLLGTYKREAQKDLEKEGGSHA